MEKALKFRSMPSPALWWQPISRRKQGSAKYFGHSIGIERRENSCSCRKDLKVCWAKLLRSPLVSHSFILAILDIEYGNISVKPRQKENIFEYNGQLDMRDDKYEVWPHPWTFLFVLLSSYCYQLVSDIWRKALNPLAAISIHIKLTFSVLILCSPSHSDILSARTTMKSSFKSTIPPCLQISLTLGWFPTIFPYLLKIFRIRIKAHPKTRQLQNTSKDTDKEYIPIKVGLFAFPSYHLFQAWTSFSFQCLDSSVENS